MADYYQIPLTISPNQSFTSTIPINGTKVKLNFFVSFNTISECWYMTIKDSNNKVLISSIPLVAGIYLLEQQDYLNIGKCYILNVDKNSKEDRPNQYNLGSKFILVWTDDGTISKTNSDSDIKIVYLNGNSDSESTGEDI